MNYALSSFALRTLAKRFVVECPNGPADEFTGWIIKTHPLAFTESEQADQRSCPNLKTANIHMRFVRSNILKELREYGLYEDNARTFSETEIEETIELASNVRAILEKSWVSPEPLQLAGVNMPEGINLDGKRIS
jgi:hypothetical protein